MSRPLPRSLAAAACLPLLVTFAGCSAAGGAESPGRPGSTSSAAPAASGTPTHDSGAAAAGIDPANPPTPVAVIAIACRPGTPFTEARVAVLGVARRDKLAVATFAVTAVPNPSYVPKEQLSGLEHTFWSCNYAGWKPSLIDGTNLVSYTPVDFGVGNNLATDVSALSLNGTPTYLYAVFPAPKEGLATIDVVVGAGIAPAVPIR